MAMLKLLKYSMLSFAVVFAAGALNGFIHAATVEEQQTRTLKPVWIDVRSAAEFDAGHLVEAVNIEYTQIAANIAEVAPDKNTPVNLYCRSGRRSEMAREALMKLGYTNVVNKGGYEELLKNK